MVKFLRKIVVLKLNFAAKILLWRKKPEVIAITGSAGKTTTKELITHLLSDDFDVLASSEGYNTELGAPMVLFASKSPINTFSIAGWFKILVKAYWIALFTRDYPEKIILEMGADAPGDIEYLTKIFKPEKGVVLTVLPVHTESFVDEAGVAKEKGALARNVVRGGKVFLNADNEYTREMNVREGATRVTFGVTDGCSLCAKDIKADLSGIRFILQEEGKEHEIKARLYGDHMIYPLLAAIAVARSEHISFKKIQKLLSNAKPFKGRMNVLEGKRGSIIIDDSYNANPESVKCALDFLSRQTGRKIAALGTMGELGEYEKKGHEEVGEKAAKVADILVVVGDLAGKYMAPAALGAGMKQEKVKTFSDSVKAGDYLKKIVRDGDVVLLKGSQNAARMERAVKAVLKDEKEAEKLLVRQSEFWKNK